jgi:hypothetical protein
MVLRSAVAAAESKVTNAPTASESWSKAPRSTSPVHRNGADFAPRKTSAHPRNCCCRDGVNAGAIPGAHLRGVNLESPNRTVRTRIVVRLSSGNSFVVDQSPMPWTLFLARPHVNLGLPVP